MDSRWDEDEAAGFGGDLGPRIYSSRLIGSDPSLVLHGGGNTSVKLQRPALFGGNDDVLLVKGSGVDLAKIEADQFTPLRLAHLLELVGVAQLSDREFDRQLRVAMMDSTDGAPSVETLLHAVIPHSYVDHSHAAAVLTLTNTPSGERHISEAFGDLVIVVPYMRPGFGLARLCAKLVAEQMTDATIGLVLLHHGLVSFGQTARESYERMIELVTRAEEYLRLRGAVTEPDTGRQMPDESLGAELAELRFRVSAHAGFPVLLRRDSETVGRGFARNPDVATLSQSGPATPDHVIWTKRVPMLGRDVDAYAASYQAYFETHAASQESDDREPGAPLVMLDPAPRVVLDPALGLCTIGRTATEAATAADIYRQTIDLILRASALERWQALPAADVFAVEYWPAEQSKLRRDETPLEFAGEVALITGAASGIGAACVDEFLARGAAVCGIDIDPSVTGAFSTPSFLGVACDVTQEADLAAAIERATARFGGVDMLVLSAGVFPSSARIDALDLSEWHRVFSVNADANLAILRLAVPFLRLAPRGGRVLVVASKNVPAPGPGAAAYSASKAALTQLARVAALEWGPLGIRVNIVHPNAVFDTGIWTEDVIQARAAEYGMTSQEYRTHNVLGVEVTSADVARLAATMCGMAFAKTTGAQVPVDGGNERVI